MVTAEPGRLTACRPPLLAGRPLLGNIAEFLRDPITLMYDGYRRHGPVFRINLAGGSAVVFAGPEATRFIAKMERDYFTTQGMLDSAAKIFESSNECMMVALDGERHRQVRGHQKEAMSRGFFEKHFAEASAMADGYFSGLPVGAALSITDFSKRLIFDQLGQVMAGESRPELFEPGKVIMDTLVDTLAKPWSKYAPFHPRAKSALRAFQRYARELEQKLSGIDASRNDLNLSETVIAGVKQGIYKQGDVAILLTGPYIAGLDTAAHALAFALYAVCNHPGVYQQVRAEIDAALADGQALTPEKLKNMQAVKGAVLESMRLYPVTVLQTRVARQDFVANGYQVRQGERVFFAPTVAHRMAEFYPNPQAFDIHRFDKDRAEHRAAGAFQPYGVGPHICLGAGVADVMIALNLVCILRSYDVRLSPRHYKLKVKVMPTPAPVDLKVRFYPRQAAGRLAA